MKIHNNDISEILKIRSMSETPHLCTIFYFHMHMIRIDTKSFSVIFSKSGPPRKNKINPRNNDHRIGTLFPTLQGHSVNHAQGSKQHSHHISI